MSETPSVRFIELMASKVCHDLISPVGAISNGVEILEELGADAGEEVTSLIAFSAEQASSKLKAMRMAYGLGGADISIKAEDVHETFGSYIAGEKRLSQDWDPYADLGIEPDIGFAKLLMCCLMFVSEALPKGGVISVKADGENTTLITGEGENAQLRDGTLHALERQADENTLEPKQVHSYLTGLLAEKYGFEIEIDESEDNFIFLRLKLPNVNC